MNCFADTSALFAVLDKADSNHEKAKNRWGSLLADDNILISSNYVVLEMFALVRKRLGIAAVRKFQEDVVPVLRVEWIGRELHDLGVSALLSWRRKRSSLVDMTSFELMRKLGIRKAFTFDSDFKKHGFEII